MTGRAGIERLLDAGGVEFLFIRFGEGPTWGGKRCVESGADRRDHRLRDVPRILCIRAYEQ